MQQIFKLLTLLVFSYSALASANPDAHGSLFKVQPKQVVHSLDGIPIYSQSNTEESSICGWLPYQAKLETSEFGRADLVKAVQLDSKYSINCPQADLFVPTGFIEAPADPFDRFRSDPADGYKFFSGKGRRSSSRTWKSPVPRFDVTCKERRGNNKIIVNFVGDLLLHGALQNQAYNNGGGFQTVWSELRNSFASADISYVNFEGAAAKGVNCGGQITQNHRERLDPECRKSRSSVYTSYPLFNYHPRVATDLKSSGFDVVSTANNHSLDRFRNGVDLTINTLNEAGLAFTGTRKQDTAESWYTITRTRASRGKVFRLAWLSCTFSYNGIADRKNQVLSCYNFNSKGHPVLSQTNPEVLKTVRALASNTNIDGVIVTPHWGPTEYVHSVHPSQTRLADELVDAGAIAVIGAHPHVLQPWEVIPAPDGRKAFVHYSLGNFVSNQKQHNRRASMILSIGFQFDRSGKLQIDGVRYIPTYLNRWGTNRYARELIPLDRGRRVNAQGRESLNNILKYFPEESRLDSTQPLTTCM